MNRKFSDTWPIQLVGLFCHLRILRILCASWKPRTDPTFTWNADHQLPGFRFKEMSEVLCYFVLDMHQFYSCLFEHYYSAWNKNRLPNAACSKLIRPSVIYMLNIRNAVKVNAELRVKSFISQHGLGINVNNHVNSTFY